MFKKSVLLIFFSIQILFGQQGIIQGIVKDADTKQPLVGANILLRGKNSGTISGSDGEFLLNKVENGDVVVVVSFLGYKKFEKSLVIGPKTVEKLEIFLEPTSLLGKEIVVVATRAVAGETPVAFATLEKEDINRRYFIQDIPVMLSEMPSTTFYSESGNGVGYNYLSIRGFDQRRISVMINGVPQNDPEDHNVYWVDFPDFLGNVEDIQVQRGAGNAFYGPPAIGGSVNILTSHFSQDKGLSVYVGRGSYYTQKYSMAINSGLIKNNFLMYGRFSYLKSDGYRDRSWVDFKSYFVGLAHFSKNGSTRIHFYGGPIKDGLVYEGLPKFVNGSKDLRKANLTYWEVDTLATDKYDLQVARRPDEIENFNQPHLELIQEFRLKKNLVLRNTLFGIRGYGFFDYDGTWAPFSYYRLTPEYGFEVEGDPESQYAQEILIRAYVDNRQIGWLPQLQWDFSAAKVVLGGELRLHRSLHWGRIQKGSSDLPKAVGGEFLGSNYIGNRRYYQYKGGKLIFSPYIHSLYRFSSKFLVMLDLQFARKKYRLYEEKFLDNEFELHYNFFNPRIGLNYRIKETLNLFGSFSRTTREPRLKTYYDAAEASTPENWGPVLPQFESFPDGRFDYSKPLVHPETLNDFEMGLAYTGNFWNAGLNLFYMDFNNEIIKMGQVDRFGQPVTGNADQTLHQGIEISLQGNVSRHLTVNGNFTYSKNELKKYSVFSWGGEEEILDGNTIAGFPNTLSNLGLNYNNKWLYTSLTMQHVGKKYIHNFNTEHHSEAYIQEHTVDAYTVFNGMIGIYFPELSGVSQVNLQLHILNIFNQLYFSHGYLTFGDRPSFFPAAPRQLFVNLKLEL